MALSDRLDGRPKQQTELTGSEGGPVKLEGIVVEFAGGRGES
jgi:hypothetical protein